MDKPKDIEEIIAEARAEESAAAERKPFDERLFKKPKDVSVELEEYVRLRMKETDLNRLISAIIQGDDIEQVFRVLYPELYLQMKEGD
jgi:hypothetical protein